QAEDGIRDPLVTGVQTCALPISSRVHFPLRDPKLEGDLKAAQELEREVYAGVTREDLQAKQKLIQDRIAAINQYRKLGGRVATRSEERRVGKEGRSRERARNEQK